MDLAIHQDSPLPGAILMAQDRALLESLDRAPMGSVLRFYEWSEPTISLGFHQSADILDSDRMVRDSLPWVRRPTGGAAVLHSEELTYAIVVPFDGRSAAAALIQEATSRALADGLRAVGVEAEVFARGEPLSSLPNRTSCFARTSRWEVVARGKKIVGSAQRRLTRAVLQHGSILTGDDHLRIVEYLRLPDESARRGLQDRLRERSTSVAAELGMLLPNTVLREALARSFAAVFRNVHVSSRTKAIEA
ncbi:lipoate--protein ligase family protein [bacterium]|nr:lipoate--protein ligase family protein [bacterium]MBU1982867.1 lipoate--protein ligase family protein [bacterium]